MDASSPKGISKDASRHVGNYTHHVERTKDMRLDRQDGTGRGHEGMKKGGNGKGNWGSELDVSEAATDVMQDDGPEAVSPRDFVENDDVVTLEEYEKRKAAEKA